MQLVQTVAPLVEPLTLDEAKDFLRVLDNDSDTLISSMISAVREHVQNVTNRQLEVATYELYADSFISALSKNPIKSIDKIEYMDANGDYLLLDSNLYYLYEDLEVGHIDYLQLVSAPYPNIQDHKKAVKITFTCGYDKVPEAIKAYMRVKISTLFENREEFVIGAPIAEFGSRFIENLLSPYKIKEF